MTTDDPGTSAPNASSPEAMLADLAARMRLAGFDSLQAERLAALRFPLGYWRKNIATEFYAHLLAQPESARFIPDPATFARLEDLQRNYVEDFFSNRFDAWYLAKRKRVGQAHDQLGLPPRVYLGAMGFLMGRLSTVLSTFYGPESADALYAMAALTRLAFVDAGISLDAYQEASTTRIRELDETAQAHEARFQNLVQGLEPIVWEATPTVGSPSQWHLHDGLRFGFVSDRVEELLGAPPAHWLGGAPHWAGAAVGDDIGHVALAYEAMVSGAQARVDVEYQIRHADGRVRWLRECVRPYRPTPDTPDATVVLRGITYDATERKTLEARLAHTSRMEALGRLAGGVAHDFNNTLTVLMNRAAFARQGIPADHPVRGELDVILDAARRANQLTDQLLAYSRQHPTMPQRIDLGVEVRAAQPMLTSLTGEQVSVDVHADAGPLIVEVDPDQIRQVLLTLLANARDAMPEGGRVTVEVRRSALDAAYCRLHAVADPGERILLKVTDDGTGMDAASRARLFEPYFSTKARGRGTGLGLASVYGIVKQARGHIRVESEVGMGTSVLMYLPPAHGPVTIPRPALPLDATGGHETVLLVEDDDAVRSVVRRILTAAGYRVIEARSLGAAHAAVESGAEPIDVLLSDVVMPDGHGPDLLARLRRKLPSLPAVLMSGYPVDALPARDGSLQGIDLLTKPFLAADLLGKVRQALASTGPAPTRSSDAPRKP